MKARDRLTLCHFLDGRLDMSSADTKWLGSLLFLLLAMACSPEEARVRREFVVRFHIESYFEGRGRNRVSD